MFSKRNILFYKNNVITLIQEKELSVLYWNKCYLASPVHVCGTQRPPCPDGGHRFPLVERRGAVQGEGIKVELVVLVFQEGERRGLALLLKLGLWSGRKKTLLRYGYKNQNQISRWCFLLRCLIICSLKCSKSTTEKSRTLDRPLTFTYILYLGSP